VVVVGAGPVGLATALTLTHRGIQVQVVERDDRPGTHSYALALHPETVGLMAGWGVRRRLEQSAVAVDKLLFCDHAGPRFELDLPSVRNQDAGLLVVGQDHLESSLIRPLEQARVPIHWSHRLAGLKQDGDGVELELERLSEGMSGYAMARLEWQVDREISTRTPFVVGADGHFSMVRRKLGIEFQKVAPTQSFAVFEFKTDFDHGNKARVVYGDEGTSVMWPLPGGYCRWGFEIDETAAEQYSRDKDRLFVQVGAQGFHVLERDMLDSMIAERAPWFNGSIGQFRWRMIVRFEKRLADSFGDGRVWLAGDSAHLAGPVGMQSMNIGIREGHQLGTILADILEGKAGPEKLMAYGLDRRREWQALLGLDTVMRETAATDGLLGEYAERVISCVPAALDTLPAFAEALGMELAALS
jgi:4,5-epoxidase